MRLARWFSTRQVVTLFRGIGAKHVGFDQARKGIVEPGSLVVGQDQKSLDEMFDLAESHNLRAGKDSPFTSWTRSLDVAKKHAGNNGVVLMASTDKQISKCFPSPDQWNEDEVLVLGKVIDCIVIPNNSGQQNKE